MTGYKDTDLVALPEWGASIDDALKRAEAHLLRAEASASSLLVGDHGGPLSPAGQGWAAVASMNAAIATAWATFAAASTAEAARQATP